VLAGCDRAPESSNRATPYPSDPVGAGPALRAWAFDHQAFAPMPTPRPSDWLAEHEESGQSVAQFVADEPNNPAEPRATIVVQPLGMLADFRGPDLATQREFLALYFGLKVTTRDPVDAGELGIGTRVHHGQHQLHAGDVLDALVERLPDEAYCCIAVTDIDLFPGPSWNFVFGMANLHERTGVFSLARYDARFFGEPASDPRLIALRTYKVLAHEVGHMFAMQHCIAHLCVMNGSNNMDESDRSPLHLCASCLEKLHLVVGFPLVQRYRELQAFYVAQGLAAEAAWVEARLAAAPV
jgi:archaemetzincin